MKKLNTFRNIAWGVCSLGALLLASCEDYLEKTPDSNVDEKIVFGNYRNFQGYLDELYGKGLISYYVTGSSPWTSSFDFGDDTYCNQTFPVSYALTRGDYMWIYSNRDHNPFMDMVNASGSLSHAGLWHQAWRNIRRCNEGLENFDLLVDATDQERKLLLGQIYFFRAWNHFEVARFWGGIPYVKVLLGAGDNLKLSRLSYRETLMNVVEDLGLAAQNLPDRWDNPEVNTGRVTRGAAYALMARALLYAASPLTSRMEGRGAVYDEELCRQAAEAAYEVIASGVYSLVPWEDYDHIFTDTRPGTNVVYSSETIFQKIHNSRGGQNQVINGIGRVHTSGRFGGNNVCTFPTANFVNLYETATGYPIDDPDLPAGDFDEKLPWANRDPRLMKTILTDGVKWESSASDASAYTQLYSSPSAGLDRDGNASLSGYLIRKFTPYMVNNRESDNTAWNNFRFSCPFIRLPEVYLTFAEAVNEVWGPNTAPDFANGLTAVEAVNTVRRRVKLPIAENVTLPSELQTYGSESLPDVLPKFTADAATFRERIRNERSVELAFEGHRWHDIRRWYVAHLDKYKIRYKAEFDKEHTFYREVELFTAQFDDKHYWFPFRRSDVEQYEGFEQNPGW